MGTVGLSFGSPTSGAGFDVSSTVAQIVGNLRNVETPWNTQLTALHSQDTTISSLGLLYSNLSKDLGALTELNGIISQKTGSSSDSNVLTLTAANNAALAGTHTVTVTNLARTSSGYLAPITSASAKLSGSIMLQVGNGKAQTIALTSADNTLSGLASAINSSGVGVIASVLTDSSGSRLSLVSGISGNDGNITISANSITAANTTLKYSGVAGTSKNDSTGTFTSITNAGDMLAGNLSIQVGNGTAANVVIGAVPSGGAAANTIYTGSGVNTLTGVVDAINGAAGLGFTASVVTNSDGSSSLSLLSLTAGSAGTLTVASNIVDSSDSLGYTSTVNGKDAQMTIDGVSNLTSASNTVANLIPGITFQLLSPSAAQSDGSLEQVQVVIGNDNGGVESTFNQMVSDYNALISAINTQEGNDSSGVAEPLFGSPTLSLLQQKLMGGLNSQSPNGNLDSIAADTNTRLDGKISVTVGGGLTDTFIVGDGINTANTFYTGSGKNTLDDLANAINAANNGTTLNYLGAAGDTTGALALVEIGTGLSGTIALSAGSGTTENFVLGTVPETGAAANTIYSGSYDNTLSGLADIINAANTGTTLSYRGAAGSSTGALATVESGKALSGAIAITVGSGTTENIVLGKVPEAGAADNTFYTGSDSNTLSGVADAINQGGIGVTASVTIDANGLQTLTLTTGTADALTASSSIVAAGLGVTASVTTDANGLEKLTLDTGTTDALTASSSIHAAGPGVTATVVTKNGLSTLALTSQTAGAKGALATNSAITATSDTPLSYSGSAGSKTTNSAGTLTAIASASDLLSGSIAIKAGSGTAMEFDLATLTDKNLSGLSWAINNASIGVTASVVANNDGSSSLKLVSQTANTAGNLIVSSSLLDTINPKTTTLNYSNSSDINNLTSLGISVNNDGTLRFDAATLDSVLNSDYSSVAGFFQNANSWGQTFSAMLTGSGTKSVTGILALAAKANNSVESTLNADISKEEILISLQQKNLTKELNMANQIMQSIPRMMNQVNMLYAAITGYNQNQSG